MRVTVRLFAILREQAKTGKLDLNLDECATVQAAVAAVGEKLPSVRDLLPRVAFAVNREYVKPETILHDGDELALIPPVSGG
jgi:molybdopterin synthase catalytic subunit